MCWKPRIELLVILAVISAWTVELSAQSTGKKGEAPKSDAPLPEWSEIETTVNSHFSGATEKPSSKRRKSRYPKASEGPREDDLITQQDLSGLFEKLEKQGWLFGKRDRKELEGRLLSESDFLVRQLRTAGGKRFMRKMSSFPGGYDRLDRLQKMPYGRKQIQNLIKGPDGAKLVEYLTKTKEGKNLGKQLSQSRTGRNFNQPTGRIYTRKDFLNQLEQSYQTEVERREAAAAEEPKKTGPRKKSV